MKENGNILMGGNSYSLRGGHITWIDTMKALLIISVVIGHSTSPFVTYIYLFHMPAFFLVSGYTCKRKINNGLQFLIQKITTILVPAFLINILFILFYFVIQKVGFYTVFQVGEPVSLGDRLKMLFGHLQTTDLGGATWFLFVIFEVKILFYFFDVLGRMLRRSYIVYILTFFMGGIGYYLATVQHVFLPYQLDLALIACIFYGIGALAAEVNGLDMFDNKVMVPFCIVFTVFFGQFYFSGTLPMNWPTRQFTNIFIQLFSCFCATYLVWNAALYLDVSKIGRYLRWLGKHTYCILITHFFVFRIIFAIGIALGRVPLSQLQNLTPDTTLSAGGGWVLISVLTVLICSCFAWIAEKNKVMDFLLNGKPINSRLLRRKNV